MSKRGHIKGANSASFCDKSGRFVARFVNEPLVLFPRSQLHNPDFSSKILEFASCNRNAESSEKIKSKKPIKSFCYFLLSQKVESPLLLNFNQPNKADSQNLVKNNRARSAHLESRPLRGAKNRIQGCSSATADFLLEAEKRGSPPKSEKAELFGAQGERGGGCSPFCEKESSEIDENSVRIAESKRDFSPTAQNDKIMDCHAQQVALAMTKWNHHKTNLRHLA